MALLRGEWEVSKYRVDNTKFTDYEGHIVTELNFGL